MQLYPQYNVYIEREWIIRHCHEWKTVHQRVGEKIMTYLLVKVDYCKCKRVVILIIATLKKQNLKYMAIRHARKSLDGLVYEKDHLFFNEMKGILMVITDQVQYCTL